MNCYIISSQLTGQNDSNWSAIKFVINELRKISKQPERAKIGYIKFQCVNYLSYKFA